MEQRCKITCANAAANDSVNERAHRWPDCGLQRQRSRWRSRSEAKGVRASGRVLNKSHSTILRWQQRLAEQADAWSPPAPEGSEVTLENDELYTRVGETSLCESDGWTITSIERQSLGQARASVYSD
jgi:hypothetical protein